MLSRAARPASPAPCRRRKQVEMAVGRAAPRARRARQGGRCGRKGAWWKNAKVICPITDALSPPERGVQPRSTGWYAAAVVAARSATRAHGEMLSQSGLSNTRRHARNTCRVPAGSETMARVPVVTVVRGGVKVVCRKVRVLGLGSPAPFAPVEAPGACPARGCLFVWQALRQVMGTPGDP